ncbi:MAG TPA: HIT family protein [Acidimicrobiales bacterium]|nr:HIT family protein [Acidimicrobiales bacterium]
MSETESMAVCAFCAVIDGSTPAEVVLADDVAVGFLDHRPVFKGHVLVVPRDHVVTLTDLPADAVGPLFQRVRRVTAAVQAAMSSDGSFVAINNVVSQSVAHLHIHVVPRRRKDGLRGFFWPRVRYDSPEEMAEVAARIRALLT